MARHRFPSINKEVRSLLLVWGNVTQKYKISVKLRSPSAFYLN